jgi:hypothetical protein
VTFFILSISFHERRRQGMTGALFRWNLGTLDLASLESLVFSSSLSWTIIISEGGHGI